MVVLQAVVDESGGWGDGDNDEVFMVAGFISTSGNWRDFANEWVEAGLPRNLKMAKAMNRASKGKPNEVERVLRMVESHALYRVECAVHLDSYRCVAKGKFDRVIDSPYFFAFQELCRRIWETAVTIHKHTGTIDFFFDDGPLGRRAEKWYDLARCFMSRELAAMMPRQIYFKTDEEFLPLKCADLLAGLARRDHNGDTTNLEGAIARVNKIRSVNSPPLEEDHFRSLLAAESSAVPEACLADWKKRWNWN
jgi:hypothetical protein